MKPPASVKQHPDRNRPYHRTQPPVSMSRSVLIAVGYGIHVVLAAQLDLTEAHAISFSP